MSGVLIVGAWFLGVLNSHGNFFLPFVAPTLWNLAQIGGLFAAKAMGSDQLAHALAWSALAGSLLQVGIQIPATRRRVGSLKPRGEWGWEPVRRVARNTLPVISSQGIFQVSTLVDISLATMVGTSAMSALGYSQRLMYLPISLFGISVAASSLPRMSREATAERLRPRLVNGFFQILYFVLPAAICFLVAGDLVVRLVRQRGEFHETSTVLVSSVLGAYALGLVASSNLKLFASGFHALQDTRTPMLLAAVSVTVGIIVAVGLTLAGRSNRNRARRIDRRVDQSRAPVERSWPENRSSVRPACSPGEPSNRHRSAHGRSGCPLDEVLAYRIARGRGLPLRSGSPDGDRRRRGRSLPSDRAAPPHRRA
jgi:putative peptidoglycan lipid II flippase